MSSFRKDSAPGNPLNHPDIRCASVKDGHAADVKRHAPVAGDGLSNVHLGETGPLSQRVQAGRKALRIRHMNGMEVRKKVRKKRPRGLK